jgi:hypothetical protein
VNIRSWIFNGRKYPCASNVTAAGVCIKGINLPRIAVWHSTGWGCALPAHSTKPLLRRQK